MFRYADVGGAPKRLDPSRYEHATSIDPFGGSPYYTLDCMECGRPYFGDRGRSVVCRDCFVEAVVVLSVAQAIESLGRPPPSVGRSTE